jgi:hypothetical protein
MTVGNPNLHANRCEAGDVATFQRSLRRGPLAVSAETRAPETASSSSIAHVGTDRLAEGEGSAVLASLNDNGSDAVAPLPKP